MQLRIDVIGEPSVDATLDFGFDTQDISVPITLDRIVLYAPPPEMPYEEDLEFLTDIIPLKDGKEQRISPRKNPRQYFRWNHVIENGPHLQRFHNIMYEWQTRTFGIPIWDDMVFLSSDAAAGSGSIDVTNTQYTDFREGELIVIYKDDTISDVLTADTVGSTTIILLLMLMIKELLLLL
jgi:predicted secreted protein